MASSSSTPYFSARPYFNVDGNGDRQSETRVPHRALYRAAHRGDWETTNSILLNDCTLKVASLNVENETVLHVAVGTGKAIHYVQKLVNAMQPEELVKFDVYGQSPLMVATIIGNIHAAKLLVHKNTKLLYMYDNEGLLPIHRAAQYGQKEMLLYLLKVTSSDDPNPYADESGAKLLAKIMEAEFYDVATSLLRGFPQLIDDSFTRWPDITPPLTVLASNPSAFKSKSVLSRLIQACTPDKCLISYDNYSIGSVTRGGEGQLEQAHSPPGAVIRYLTCIFQKIRPTKSLRDQAIQLVNCLCTHASTSAVLSLEEFKVPFHLAAKSGIVEIVEELAETFPNLLWEKNSEQQNIFQVAVLQRHQNVYNLVYRIAKDKRYKIREPDNNGNNILHMAGKLAPLHRLNMISGAALKMRYELQWFKEVGRSIQPFQRGAVNNDEKTPKEVFTEEHMGLVKEGEKWMKSTASSCTTPAALIATVAFAAAIAVPSSSNFSSLRRETAYKVFAYADAISLFTSLSSLLMFVSVLTSRYREDEFLRSLPLRILIGLLTLIISIESMTVAFSMILYLAFGKGERWVLDVVVTAACVPATLFVMFHYSLLTDMIYYWKFPQISGKKGGRPLYTRIP